MNVEVSLVGTIRRRMRFKFLWFWIVGPWKRDRVREVITFPLDDFRHVVRLGPVNGEVTFGDGSVRLTILGMPVFSLPLDAHGSMPIKGEPVKGIILDLELSAKTV